MEISYIYLSFVHNCIIIEVIRIAEIGPGRELGTYFYARLFHFQQTDNTFRWSYGGFQGARGAWDGKEWYIDNIFEELDVAGEWFLDETTMKLFYFPSGSLPNEVCDFYYLIMAFIVFEKQGD